MSDMRECHIYLMVADCPLIEPAGRLDLVKVGVAHEPRNRLREISTGCPYPLTLRRSWLLPSRSAAFLAEKHVHDVHGDVRLSGEWFRETLAEITDGICSAIMDTLIQEMSVAQDRIFGLIRRAGFSEAEAVRWYTGWYRCAPEAGSPAP